MRHQSSSFLLAFTEAARLGHGLQVLEQPAHDLRSIRGPRLVTDPPGLDPRQRPRRGDAPRRSDLRAGAARAEGTRGRRRSTPARGAAPGRPRPPIRGPRAAPPSVRARLCARRPRRGAAAEPTAWIGRTSGGARPGEQLLQRALPAPPSLPPPHRRLFLAATSRRGRRSRAPAAPPLPDRRPHGAGACGSDRQAPPGAFGRADSVSSSLLT